MWRALESGDVIVVRLGQFDGVSVLNMGSSVHCCVHGKLASLAARARSLVSTALIGAPWACAMVGWVGPLNPTWSVAGRRCWMMTSIGSSDDLRGARTCLQARLCNHRSPHARAAGLGVQMRARTCGPVQGTGAIEDHHQPPPPTASPPI